MQLACLLCITRCSHINYTGTEISTRLECTVQLIFLPICSYTVNVLLKNTCHWLSVKFSFQCATWTTFFILLEVNAISSLLYLVDLGLFNSTTATLIPRWRFITCGVYALAAGFTGLPLQSLHCQTRFTIFVLLPLLLQRGGLGDFCIGLVWSAQFSQHIKYLFLAMHD